MFLSTSWQHFFSSILFSSLSFNVFLWILCFFFSSSSLKDVNLFCVRYFQWAPLAVESSEPFSARAEIYHKLQVFVYESLLKTILPANSDRHLCFLYRKGSLCLSTIQIILLKKMICLYDLSLVQYNRLYYLTDSMVSPAPASTENYTIYIFCLTNTFKILVINTY